jgi:RNA polymerase sigma factor for flagellar operon FliA
MQPKRDDAEVISQFIATRDPSCREAVVLRYVPLVHFVLGRLGMSPSSGPDYEDAAGQGLLGLLEAVDHYDPSHGAQFSTYATLRVRGKVIDYLRSQDWLSRGARQRARSVQNAINELWANLQRVPTDDELADHLHLEMPKLQQALADSSRVLVSLDAVMDSSSEEDSSLHEMLADEQQAEPEETLEETQLKECLAAALRALPQREQQVLSLYYYEELTFKEIGRVLGVTESRVCQMHARTVMALRAALAHNPTGAGQERPFEVERR